jgi:hypothetical protein
VETEHGRNTGTLADERASNGEPKARPKPPRHISTLPQPGEPIIQPGLTYVACSTDPERQIAALTRFARLDFRGPPLTKQRSSSPEGKWVGRSSAATAIGGGALIAWARWSPAAAGALCVLSAAWDSATTCASITVFGAQC